MSVFNKNYTLALIKEVGENDVLLSVNDQDFEIELNEDNKQAILDAVSEGIFLVPFDSEKNELLMTVDDAVLYEVFPEIELDELEGATDDLPDEIE